MNRIRFSLSQKLILSLIGSMIVIFTLLGYQSVSIHRRNLEEMTHVMADRISNTIKDGTRYSMLQNHQDEVYHIINSIGAKQGIKKIRIFNKEGKISYSTDKNEVNQYVNKQAEACYGCHTQEQPLTQLDRPDRVRTYMGPGNERILGLINPIENEPACSNAACHAHHPDQRVLGVLDVSLSLAGVDQTIIQGRKKMVVSFVAAVIIISIVFSWLIWGMIHRPVKKLIRGTKHVASGDLNYRIDVQSRDEIGDLAFSFNQMTGELKHANEELTEWTHTLENRVEEKTNELKAAQDEMIRVERMASVGKLAAIVAHEINNPLAGILTYAKLLLRKIGDSPVPETGEMKHSLEMIAGESARCGEIVKNLLEFSRQSVPHLSPQDVNELTRQSVRLVKHKMDLLNVEAAFDLDEKLPVVVCDGQQIKQALVAILINACEAVKPGEGVITIASRAIPERKVVRITLKDNGTGMDEETKKHIFEPFFTTKEMTRGMGLGLAVVLGIVSRHSGSIQVESEPGQGSVFTIDLPENPSAKELQAESEGRSVVMT